MSILLNVCGLILSTQTIPDSTLQQFYREYYHCNIQTLSTKASQTLSVKEPISAYFPTQRQWWPVFTLDQVNSKSYKRVVENGIKPGIVIPDEYFSFQQYLKAKHAVNEGAIPVILFKPAHPHYFASKATFSTAIGLRPLAALVPTGWDANLNVQPPGTYLIQSQNNNTLPLPAREIKSNGHYFYHTQPGIEQGNGYQVIVNPSEYITLESIRYPKLGIVWDFNNIRYESTPEGVQTGALGYLFIILSTVVVPLDLILPRNYPDLLRIFGSSISWISLFLGGLLLLILIISIIRKVRSNGAD